MPIKFTCSQCGQVLRVADDAAGKRARCPKCQNVVMIPTPEVSTPPADADDWNLFADTPLGTDTANPYLAPAGPGYPSSTAAGSTPFAGGKITNVPTDVGSILNYAVEIWKANLGLLVGGLVVMMCISGAVSFATESVATLLVKTGLRPLVLPFAVVAAIGRFVVDTFLAAGYWQMLLKMARRRRVEFNDLFGGGSVLLPTLGISVLFSLAVFLGFLCLIVPGILVLLVWWPCYYLVIDRKASVGESIGLAREVTANNIGTSFLVGLLSMGISGLGILACCVGVFVAFPLSSLLTTVAYLMMSGQLPLNAAQQTGK